MIARLTDDRAHVEIEGALWRDRFPLCALPAWLAFYSGLRDRRGGRYADRYAETVRALERVAKDAGVRS